MIRFSRHRFLCVIGTACAITSSSMAMAAQGARTRLVSCGSGSCLLVTGHRESADSLVSFNNRLMTVEGGLTWRIRLPLAAVREYSSPMARSIQVTVMRADGREVWSKEASLPIGLLGHNNLATLVVSSR